MRVEVYWNLHKNRFSVRALDGRDKGIVIAHCEYVALTDATFHVQQAGRRRVIETGRKNVHAVIRGDLASFIGTGTAHVGGFCLSETYGEGRRDPHIDAIATAISLDSETPARDVRYNPRRDSSFMFMPFGHGKSPHTCKACPAPLVQCTTEPRYTPRGPVPITSSPAVTAHGVPSAYGRDYLTRAA